MQRLLQVRRERAFTSLTDFCTRVPEATSGEVEHLILGGAFDTLHPRRRALLWQLPAALRRSRQARERQRRRDVEAGDDGLMSAGASDEDDFSPWERDVREFHALGLTVRRHLLHHWRDALKRQGARTCREALSLPDGHPVTLGGLCLRPHRPPTKSGRTVVFLTLEDETGLVDVTVFEDVYMRYGQDLFVKPLLLVGGVLRRSGDGVSVTARHVTAFGI